MNDSISLMQALDKNRIIGLTKAEEGEWTQYEYIEHLTWIAKAKAFEKLRSIS